MARTDFRSVAARRLSEERELSPAIVSLLSSDRVGHSTGVRLIPVDRIEPNPQQPRLAMDATMLEELAASIREHGVLQPILVRPLGNNEFQQLREDVRRRYSDIKFLDDQSEVVKADGTTIGIFGTTGSHHNLFFYFKRPGCFLRRKRTAARICG